MELKEIKVGQVFKNKEGKELRVTSILTHGNDKIINVGVEDNYGNRKLLKENDIRSMEVIRAQGLPSFSIPWK